MSEICSIYGDAPYPLMVKRASRAGCTWDHHVQRRFHVDVVVTQSAAVLELSAGVDEAKLVRRNAPVPDLLLDAVDRVARLDVERERLARHGLDEDLHIGAALRRRAYFGTSFTTIRPALMMRPGTAANGCLVNK